MKTAPTLETNRLILRAHTKEDFHSSHSMWSNPEVVKFITGQPSNEQQSWGRVLNYTGHWALMGFGYWAVFEKSSGNFIGELGLADFKREMNPSIREIPELGWALKPEFHGKGYALEALNEVIAWAEKNLAVKKIACIINPANLSSIKLAEKLSFKEAVRTQYMGNDVILYYR